MKIAVIGGGISGLTAAYRLAEEHEVTLFEAEQRLGGHTHTVALRHHGRDLALDTGFLVYNERTYPEFTRLLEEWGVESQASEMSFSVHCESTGLEYCGSSLSGLFAQRINLLRPDFYRMLADIVRFNRRGSALLAEVDEGLSLGELLDRERYGRGFVEHYLLPMGAAIWSAPPDRMCDFPALAFLRFFANHGLLSLGDRPQWRTIRGGSSRYIEAILRKRPIHVEQAAPIKRIERFAEHVIVELKDQRCERFDQVVVATHADQALRLLADPSPAEREVLGAFKFQRNSAVLHTDVGRLPRRRRAWASWNYRVPAKPQHSVSVTYLLNRLQHIDGETQYCVSLNDSRPFADADVLRRMNFEHPLFTTAAMAAQRRHGEISGRRRTHYCGAYWGYGFHEDGVKSALVVLAHLHRQTVAPCIVTSMKA